MKKYYYIALAIMAVSLGACSKNSPSTIAGVVDTFADAPWALDESLPVPIQFGTNAPFYIETKAAPITTANFADAKLKITAVNKESVTETLFADAPATVADGFIQFLDGEGENANPINRYYPQVSKDADRVNYSFIGYQLPAGSGYTSPSFSLIPSSNDVNVDILWAKSEAEDLIIDDVTYQGFNAQYIRQARLNGVLEDKRPSFTFEHKAALIHFLVCGEDLGASADETYTFNDGADAIFSVTDLKVAVRHTDAELNLLTGELTVGEGVSDEFYEYRGFDQSEASVSTTYTADYAVDVQNATETEYGTGVFILPGERTQGTDEIQIQFTLVNNETKESQTYGDDVNAPISLPIPEGGYVAGTEYFYKITVKSATQIRIQASLTNYSSGGTFDVITIE